MLVENVGAERHTLKKMFVDLLTCSTELLPLYVLVWNHRKSFLLTVGIVVEQKAINCEK